MCIIQIRTTSTCSSAYKLVEKSNMCPCACLGPMQEMGMKFKHEGIVDCRQNIEMSGFYIRVNPKLVWNSWNLACYHGAASTCRGKKFVPFGAGSGISLSQTRASHNKHDGFDRERPTFGDETISIASYCFQKISRVNIEQQECCVIFCDFSGFVWTFFMH